MKSSWLWWAAGAAGAAGIVGVIAGLKGSGLLESTEDGLIPSGAGPLFGRSPQDILDAVDKIDPAHNPTLQSGYLGQPNWCNRFAALVTAELGVGIIFGEYGTRANDQIAWLDAGNGGWFQVSSKDEAQRLAMEGNVVLATYYNMMPGASGHMALVLPLPGTMQIAQAGKRTFNRGSLAQGFGAINPVFYAHS
jgi:hypothetical protein